MVRFTALCAAFFFAASAFAQDAQPAVPVDRAALEAYADGLVRAYREQLGIAGVSVAIVDRDRVLLQKGYGFVDVNGVKPVDPQNTLFRIASISKTFTYILAMQLAEEGKLDLNADANAYLPEALKIPDDGFGVVRMLDLMQHTAGFEDSALGHLFFDDAAKSGALEDYLAVWRPRRVRKTGDAAVYSNYGVALLGAIIARIEGASFESIVEKRILSPLGIDRITFREQRPDGDPHAAPQALTGLWSTGFKREAGWFTAMPYEFIAHAGPAGAASASAGGMTRYMRMLLNGGTLDGVTILKPESFAKLSSLTFRNAPGVSGFAHGFFRARYGAYESLEHGGATIFFHSNMVIWPEAGIAVFITTNTNTGVSFARVFPRHIIEFLDTKARPELPRLPDPTATLQPDLFQGAGDYLSLRRTWSSFEGFIMRLAGSSTVAAMPDGSVLISGGRAPRRYAMFADGVLQDVETGETLQALKDKDGRITGLAYSSMQTERLGPAETPMTLLALTIFTLIGSLWAWRGAFARWWRSEGIDQSALERVTGIAALGAAALWIGALISFLLGALPLTSAPEQAVFAYPQPLLSLARTLLHGAAALSLISLPLLWGAWSGAEWSLWRRLSHTAFVLCAGTLSVVLFLWGALLTPLTIAG